MQIYNVPINSILFISNDWLHLIKSDWLDLFKTFPLQPHNYDK